eukprot:CAMPEP_0176187778 /NCGR_PEP_ID=MMETSP0121_2-20121125/2574_1 /TAXON_ID=160619 /ORGANISM="Kryptoperidinium foliaceum, Strain CCMP 1326" /LENGTH=108 /DNA_ID=CAMNT_0017526331 /DNA_START=48 /DNA_END=374 /DNA_ORIENTATION=-
MSFARAHVQGAPPRSSIAPPQTNHKKRWQPPRASRARPMHDVVVGASLRACNVSDPDAPNPTASQSVLGTVGVCVRTRFPHAPSQLAHGPNASPPRWLLRNPPDLMGP